MARSGIRTKKNVLIKVTKPRGVKLFLEPVLQASNQVFPPKLPALQVICSKQYLWHACIETPQNWLMFSSMSQASHEKNVLAKWDSMSTWLKFWAHSSSDAINRIDGCLCIRNFFFRNFSIFGFSNSNPNPPSVLFSFNNLTRMGVKNTLLSDSRFCALKCWRQNYELH